MSDGTAVSQNARKAIQAIDSLQNLYSGLVNNQEDRAAVSDLLQDLRDAIEEVNNILSRISPATEGTLRSELQQEHEAKSTAQEQRYASGPVCN